MHWQARMFKKKSEFKNIIDESTSLINNLKSYEEKIKKLDNSVHFLKEKTTLSKIKQQLDNKDSIIKELAEAKITLKKELKDKNDLINDLRKRLQSTGLELDKKSSEEFLLSSEAEKNNQLVEEKNIALKQTKENIQLLNKEIKGNQDLINKLKKEFDNKNKEVFRSNENLKIFEEKVKKLNLSQAALHENLSIKEKEISSFKEKYIILNAANKEMMIKHNDISNELLAVNQKISEQTNVIHEMQSKMNEKDQHYLMSLDAERQKYNKQLEEIAKQNIRSELELKTQIKGLELQNTKQKTKVSSQDKKEKEFIEELKLKLHQLEKLK